MCLPVSSGVIHKVGSVSLSFHVCLDWWVLQTAATLGHSKFYHRKTLSRPKIKRQKGKTSSWAETGEQVSEPNKMAPG